MAATRIGETSPRAARLLRHREDVARLVFAFFTADGVVPFLEQMTGSWAGFLDCELGRAAGLGVTALREAYFAAVPDVRRMKSATLSWSA